MGTIFRATFLDGKSTGNWIAIVERKESCLKTGKKITADFPEGRKWFSMHDTNWHFAGIPLWLRLWTLWWYIKAAADMTGVCTGYNSHFIAAYPPRNELQRIYSPERNVKANTSPKFGPKHPFWYAAVEWCGLVLCSLAEVHFHKIEQFDTFPVSFFDMAYCWNKCKELRRWLARFYYFLLWSVFPKLEWTMPPGY